MEYIIREMCEPAFWYQKQINPEAVLADYDQIKDINRLIAEDPDTGVRDLKKEPETFDGAEFNKKLLRVAEDNIDWYLAQAKTMYTDGGEALNKDSFENIVRNTQSRMAESHQHVQYGIVTNRTSFRGLPTDMMILDEKTDYNFDYLYSGSINVNEPLIIKSLSADGIYFYAIGTNCEGWVPKEDVAICSDKKSWQRAWDIDPADVLVIYEDKLITETTRVDKEISNRLLGMGTVLEKVSEEECSINVSNRVPIFNHVVWLPIRKEDGSYGRSMALIPFHKKVSEGYLPLSYKNITEVAFNMLGNTYGWGGMLDSNDCSGYISDIYRCFGLVLAKNTSFQSKMPVKKYDVKDASSDEKKTILDELSLGTMLVWNGHVVLYLGKQDERYYVISSVSSAVIPDGKLNKVRNVIINSLDVKRVSGDTWLDAVETILVPYIIQPLFIFAKESI